jgi:hypothetical protein
LHARAQKLVYFPYFASVVLLQPTDRLKASLRGSNTSVATRWLAGLQSKQRTNHATEQFRRLTAHFSPHTHISPSVIRNMKGGQDYPTIRTTEGKHRGMNDTQKSSLRAKV